MNQQEIFNRSKNKCELCGNDNDLHCHEVNNPPSDISDPLNAVAICNTCQQQYFEKDVLDSNYWHCLNESIWSEHSAVKVFCYEILSKLKDHSWAIDLKEQMYLTDEELVWAKSLTDTESEIKVLDSNGARLEKGDSVTLIKDLVVKGANFTAKRGTLVKNISLTDNPDHIEGKVNGTQIVLVAKYLKKVN